MNPALEPRIEKIGTLTQPHLSLLMKMLRADGGKMFTLDMLAAAAVKRSMALCSAFALLVRAQNYVCAASLLRLQLDSDEWASRSGGPDPAMTNFYYL
jgi:hypothetical protein